MSTGQGDEASELSDVDAALNARPGGDGRAGHGPHAVGS